MELTPALAIDLGLKKKKDSGISKEEIKELDLSGRGITKLSDLSTFVDLERINLRENMISSIDGLLHNKAMVFLDLSSNQLQRIKNLEKMTNLNVLKVANCNLIDLSGLEQNRFLKVLIADRNTVKEINHIGHLYHLNTLVLSHNEITELRNLGGLRSLEKLSVSHNKLKEIPTSLKRNYNLKHLRINGNHIMTLPETLKFCAKLTHIDVGVNSIRSFEDVQVLKELPCLISLRLFGNPICQLPGYQEEILRLCPNLRVFDGVNITPKGDPNAIKKRRKGAQDAQMTTTSIKPLPPPMSTPNLEVSTPFSTKKRKIEKITDEIETVEKIDKKTRKRVKSKHRSPISDSSSSKQSDVHSEKTTKRSKEKKTKKKKKRLVTESAFSQQLCESPSDILDLKASEKHKSKTRASKGTSSRDKTVEQNYLKNEVPVSKSQIKKRGKRKLTRDDGNSGVVEMIEDKAQSQRPSGRNPSEKGSWVSLLGASDHIGEGSGGW